MNTNYCHYKDTNKLAGILACGIQQNGTVSFLGRAQSDRLDTRWKGRDIDLQ